MLSKYLIEIRFRPSPKILDRRGSIAETIADGNPLNHWNISNNRIDFWEDDNKKMEAFFSYRNLGLISLSPNTEEYFVEQAKDFLKKAWVSLPSNEISRIGIRSTFLNETEDFKKTFDSFKRSFLKLDNEHLKIFGGELIDAGFPLNFKEDGAYFNVMMGAMKKEQAEDFFDDVKISENNIFFDLDYFKKIASQDTRQKDVFSFLEKAVAKARTLNGFVLDLIAKEK